MAKRSVSPCGRAGQGEAGAAGAVEARLRRLRMQEGVFASSLSAALDNLQLGSTLRALAEKRHKDFNELTNSFYVVKSIFDKLKYNVTSDECVSKVDIEDYKKLVMELEEKMISFKKFLSKEMKELREAETILSAELKEIDQNMAEISTKLSVKPYTSFVNSTIKSLRDAPSTCTAVQRFQDYLKQNGGHRGGWGDIEHRIFVKYRQKYLKRGCDSVVSGIGDEKSYMLLLIEALKDKIPGITDEEIVKHDKWYAVYTCLKCEQQDALDKWKANRRRMKPQYQEECKKEKTLLQTIKSTEVFDLKKLKIEAKMLEQSIQDIKELTMKTKKGGEYESTACEKLVDKELQQNKHDLINSQKKYDLKVSKENSPESAVNTTNTTNLNVIYKPCTRPVERPCCRNLFNGESENNNKKDSCEPEKNNSANYKHIQIRPGSKRLLKKSVESKCRTYTKDDVSASDESAHYLVPTKSWTMRSFRDSSSDSNDTVSGDIRLHIPMGNPPKLGISNWRRCLVGDI